MVDIAEESMIKSLCVAWLKGIFGDNSGALKLQLLITTITSKNELSAVLNFTWSYWWSEFWKDNAVGTNWLYRI